MRQILLAATALGLVLPAFAQTNPDETEIPMDQVPEAVMATAQAHAEGVTFDRVSIEVEDGVEIYEFAGTKDGMGFEVDVLADGTLEEIEDEIAMEDVPEAVTAALETEMPGFAPSYIERSTRDDGALIVYEFEGQHEGQEVDVEIHEDGSNFMMNEDMAG